ncbi:hypothetical protein V527_23315 [Pseudomonas aeruginosa VRFPA06]|nr:hypothetical protein V527_23315 [Pseudomonas aeruginosa VRFPA06]OKO07949.1 hypothetical protein AM482_004062 [Pseudomonas aeruginosa]
MTGGEIDINTHFNQIGNIGLEAADLIGFVTIDAVLDKGIDLLVQLHLEVAHRNTVGSSGFGDRTNSDLMNLEVVVED